MPDNKFYFDDEEVGLARETSHPDFVKLCIEDLYYDCTDEFSPFGNDDGADLLYNLEDWYRDTKGKGDVLKWLFAFIDDAGYEYKSRKYAALTDGAKLDTLLEEDDDFIHFMDLNIIAAAFGQYKISGSLDQELKQLALKAIMRERKLLALWQSGGDDDDEADSSYMEHRQYLDIMERDISKM